MRLLAPAKLNLHLRVGPARADGFHPISSWMCTVSLFDKLEVHRSHGSGIDLLCDVPSLCCDASNLVLRAADAFAEAIGQTGEGKPPMSGMKVWLRKQIPVGAGLGGGSSDGARILAALNRLWRADWPPHRLAQFSASLGSDLPFFFFAPSAICRGRGEDVEPTPPPKPSFAVLVLSRRELHTAAVYQRFDELRLGIQLISEEEPNWRKWAELPAKSLLPLLVNDLEPAAFAIDPELGALRQELEREMARPVRMSGSGSSLFTLFDGPAEADRAAGRIARSTGADAIAVELAPEVVDDLVENLNARRMER